MNKNIYPTNLLYSSKSFLGEFLKLLRLEESWNQRRWKRFGHGIYNVDSAKSRWCYDCTRNLKGDWNTFKKVNNFLLGLLLFQATSFIQKWFTQLSRKLILISANTRKFCCYTEKTCRLSPFGLLFRWIVYLCYSSITALVLKYRYEFAIEGIPRCSGGK